jgi:hypothetical protein
MLQVLSTYIYAVAYAQFFFILIFCKEADVVGLNV